MAPIHFHSEVRSSPIECSPSADGRV